MSPEKQRIAIAEACGWKKVNYYNFNRFLWVNGVDERAEDGLPDYLNDLNAMAEAENVVFNKKDWIRYTDTLLEIQPNDQSPIRATAAQRAEAFLKTIGKWKDEHRPVIPPNPEKV